MNNRGHCADPAGHGKYGSVNRNFQGARSACAAWAVLALATACNDGSELGATEGSSDSGVPEIPDTLTIEPGVGPGGCALYESSFQAIQKEIFQYHGCTAAPCHGEAHEGGLDLRPDAAYRSLVDAP